MKVLAHYNQHFDADFSLDVPAEGYGGWKQAEIEIAPQHTAIVSMHAWDCGTREQFPGWHRAVEYMPRADEICRTVYPPLLSAVRASPMPLFHVVRPGGDYQMWPGYRHAEQLVQDQFGGEPVPPVRVESDPVLQKLHEFRRQNVFPGDHNIPDIEAGFAQLDFPPEARPQGMEGLAQTSTQLLALCREQQINHLIYAGFAIDGCLLSSPGGMADMSKHGIMCSTFQDAVTAIENKETARHEQAKRLALWRVALMFGFVFDSPDFIAALQVL